MEEKVAKLKAVESNTRRLYANAAVDKMRKDIVLLKDMGQDISDFTGGLDAATSPLQQLNVVKFLNDKIQNEILPAINREPPKVSVKQGGYGKSQYSGSVSGNTTSSMSARPARKYDASSASSRGPQGRSSGGYGGSGRSSGYSGSVNGGGY